MKPYPVSSEEARMLFHEGAQALSRIESNGIRVDVGYLTQTIKDAEKRISDMKKVLMEDPIYKTWKRVYGEKANLTSRDQLGYVIFNEMGYKCPSGFTVTKGKKRYVADEKAFEEIDIPFKKLYFEMEKISNALDTWLYGIRRGVNSKGRLHTNFHLNLVRTYRSGSNDPNFQNIPKRNWETAQMIRRCYIPEPGDHFGEIDYAQQEVRVAACYNEDPRLIAYIKDPTTDMHTDQAIKLFMLEKHQIGRKTTRDMSKNMFVFPEFYGSYYAMCAKDIWQALNLRNPKVEGSDKTVLQHLREKGIKELGALDGRPKPGTFEYHVKKVEDYLWKVFKVYAEWKVKWHQQYLEQGFFRMLTGFVIRGNIGERDSCNWPIQGSAFHCLLWSLIRLLKRLNRYKMKTLVLGEIHDSLQSSVPPKERNAFADMCHEIMVNEITKEWKWLIVPLGVEVEYGGVDESWAGIKEWIRGGNGIWEPKKK